MVVTIITSANDARIKIIHGTAQEVTDELGQSFSSATQIIGYSINTDGTIHSAFVHTGGCG